MIILFFFIRLCYLCFSNMLVSILGGITPLCVTFYPRLDIHSVDLVWVMAGDAHDHGSRRGLIKEGRLPPLPQSNVCNPVSSSSCLALQHYPFQKAAFSCTFFLQSFHEQASNPLPLPRAFFFILFVKAHIFYEWLCLVMFLRVSF